MKLRQICAWIICSVLSLQHQSAASDINSTTPHPMGSNTNSTSIDIHTTTLRPNTTGPTGNKTVVTETTSTQATFISPPSFTDSTGNSTNSTSTCGPINSLYAYVGYTSHLSSPNYPQPYPNNARCRWTITAPVGYRVRLILVDFQLETCCDRLKVYGAPSNISSNFTQLGFGDILRPITSNNNYVTLEFTSDGSIVDRGFNLTYTAVDGTTPSSTPPFNTGAPPTGTTPFFTPPPTTGTPPTPGGCTGVYLEQLRQWQAAKDEWWQAMEKWRRANTCN